MTALDQGYDWWRDYVTALTVGLVAHLGAVALALWFVGAPLKVLMP